MDNEKLIVRATEYMIQAYRYDEETLAEDLVNFYTRECESPIEVRLAVAICCAIRKNQLIGCLDGGLGGLIVHQSTAVSALSSNGERIVSEARRLVMNGPCQIDFLWSQVPIGIYRADFVATRMSYGLDRVPVYAGSEDVEPFWMGQREIINISGPIVIECDGREFHTTREQVTADRRRDVAMMSDGFPVVRFTGLEISDSPFECAEQIDGYLKDHKRMLCTLVDEQVDDEISL